MSGIVAQNTLDNTGLIKAPEGGGAWTLISKTVASDDDTVSITAGIDSTYKLYVFTFNNMLPDADGRQLQLDWSTDGGSSYGVTTTSTLFNAEHTESGSAQALHYETAHDLTQSDEPVWFANSTGGDSDQSVSGYLYLFDPSNTTFVKHYMFESNSSGDADIQTHVFGAGYLNTTSAVDALQLNFNGPAAIVSGDICLYGIST